MSIEKITLLILFVQFTPIPVLAAVFSPEQTTLIDKFVNDVMACYHVPGLVLGAVKGKDTWTRGFGVIDLDEKRSVDGKETRFAIASLTKAFTATLLNMVLGDSAGRYTWESKLTDVFGKDFQMFDKERTEETTLKDLLSHRTGLHPGNVGLFSGWTENVTRADFSSRLRFLPPVLPLRDRFVYNNWMYVLAGHAVEVISGKTWEDNLYQRILQPLRMNKTGIMGYDLTVSSPNVAQPYALVRNNLVKTDPAVYNISPGEPAGGMASTADDMTKWMYFVLHEGETMDGTRLINETDFKKMVQPHMHLPQTPISALPVTVLQYAYGYGWILGNYRGHRHVVHSGNIHAYTSLLSLYPEHHAAVFASESGVGDVQPVQVILYFLSDVILGEQPWLNSTTACSFPQPWLPLGKMRDNNNDVTSDDIQQLERFTGMYGHQLFGEVMVETGTQNTGLQLTFGRFRALFNSTGSDTKFKLQALYPLDFMTFRANDTQLLAVQVQGREWRTLPRFGNSGGLSLNLQTRCSLLR